MKILVALCAIVAVSTANVIITAREPNDSILGKDECTWGPSYWCENIKSAAKCKMTKHCISASWEHMKVPEDNDSVCNICKDMVQQARDQLESNQTQEDLKNVFEGSCKLIHIKPIVKECVSIVDEFVPDLVETLASQMNPSVVCSVAGLCNSAHIDKLLEQYGEPTSKINEIKSRSLEKDELEPDECSKCYTVATHIEFKLNNTPQDKLLQKMLKPCAYLSTFSDACSAIVLTHFDGIRAHLKDNFNAKNLCHLSGQCSNKFHVHADRGVELNVEIQPLSSVGVVDINDDLPCKLCEQLVGHLRDLLVANTTETEFQQVLRGFCKQMKSFASECTAIVDEYYPQIYEYLTKGLNSNAVCEMAELCPAPGKQIEDEEIWPLVPKNAAEVGVRIFQEAKKSTENEKQMDLSKLEVEPIQLPIERLMPFPLSEGGLGAGGEESCALCENILHYIQNTITDPVTEDKVKQAIEKVCKKLPESIQGECSEFVDNYGDAMVAILAQKIDPSQVCPMLRLCPSKRLMQFWKSIPEKYMLVKKQEKPTCPLCLLAVQQLYNVIKTNKTQANIQAALDKLCNRLPEHLKDQCVDFVKGYSKELIELMLADLTPEEICTYLKLCDDTQNAGPMGEQNTSEERQILTNEIPDSLENDKSRTILNPVCSVCLVAMREVDKQLGSDRSKNRINGVVRNICSHLPVASTECKTFVNKHGDQIINFIREKGIPIAACSGLHLCLAVDGVDELFERDGFDERFEDSRISFNPMKYVCKPVVGKLVERVGTNKNRERVESEMHRVCNDLRRISGECNKFINKHSERLIDLILKDAAPAAICGALGLRSFDEDSVPEVLRASGTQCTVCKAFIWAVDELLSNSAVDERIKDAVSKACKHLPTKHHKQCTSIVHVYGQSVINLIERHTDSKKICGKIGICAPRDYSMASPESLRSFQSSDEELQSTIATDDSAETSDESRISFNPVQHVCKVVVRKIDEKVGTNKNRERVVNAVHHVCNDVHRISRECNKFINKHGNRIIDLILKNALPDAVCAALSLRDFYEDSEPTIETGDSAETSDESRISFNPVQHVCKVVVRKIDEKVGTNKNRERVVNAVHHVCNDVHRISRECNKFINKHGNRIIDLILKNALPDAVCAALSLRDFYEDPEPTIETDDSAETSDESRISFNPVQHVCKVVVRKIDEKVGTNKNRERVVNAVHHVCNDVHRISRECNKFINKHGNRIIDLILKNALPDAVCAALSLRSFDEDLLLGEERASHVECSLCEYALHYVDVIVSDPITKDKAKNALKGVCTKLPISMEGDCLGFVRKHGDAIVNKLAGSIRPNQVCPMIRLCPSGKLEQTDVSVSNEYVPEERSEGKPSCPLCLIAMRKIYDVIENNKTEQNIESELNKLCSRLPGNWKGECTDLVKTYSKELVDLLLADLSPEEVCAYLKLCDARQNPISSNVSSRNEGGAISIDEISDSLSLRSFDEDLVPAALRASATQCTVCKAFIWAVDELLGNSAVDERIKDVVSKACKRVSSKYQKDCTMIVRVYGQSVINLIERHTDSKKICGKIGICVARDYSMVSLENSRIKRSYEKDRIQRCTWGPVYWCSTHAAALECKAVEHCREHVWKSDVAPPKQNA